MKMVLSAERRAAIRAYAAKEPNSKAAAVTAYYDALEDDVDRSDPHMLFMSETISRMPDLVLRARYRKEVLESK